MIKKYNNWLQIYKAIPVGSYFTFMRELWLVSLVIDVIYFVLVTSLSSLWHQQLIFRCSLCFSFLVYLQKEKPKNVTAIALSSDVIKVTWIPLDQREEVQSYEVEYCSIVNCTRKRVGKTADVLLKSLPQYTAFKVQVRGRNTQYAGPWEMARRMTTLGQSTETFAPLWNINLTSFA